MCFYHMTEWNSTVYSLNLDTNRKQQTLIQIRIRIFPVYPLSLKSNTNKAFCGENFICGRNLSVAL